VDSPSDTLRATWTLHQLARISPIGIHMHLLSDLPLEALDARADPKFLQAAAMTDFARRADTAAQIFSVLTR
jgi:hypothetical protein